jgi:mannose/fructose-specific phosphotransferase system component IIA
MHSTLQFIYGETSGVYYVDYRGEGDGSELTSEYRKIVLQSKEDVVFVCDLAGATPFMKSAMLQKEFSNVYTIGGVSVGAILDSLNHLDRPGDLIVQGLIATTKTNVMEYNYKGEAKHEKNYG